MLQKHRQIREAYQVLGLELGASLREAKGAYRRLIKRWHPDVSRRPVDEAERQTRRLYEAFGHLRSASEEEIADASRYFSTGAPEPDRGAARPARRTRAGRAGARRGRDVVADLVTSERRASIVPRWRLRIATCRCCGGWGAASGAAFEVCPACAGLGRHRRGDGSWDLDTACAHCLGYGCLFEQTCADCRGQGQGSFYAVTCVVPGGELCGVTHWRLAGLGHRGLAGGPAGDLYLRVIARAPEDGGDRHHLGESVAKRKETGHGE